LASLGSDELLDSEHPYQKEYKQHLQDLADIPYDGYHTDYSLWALEYAKQQDKELISPERGMLESFDSLRPSGYLPELNLPTYLSELYTKSSAEADRTPESGNELLGLPLIKEPGKADSAEEANSVDGIEVGDGVEAADAVDHTDQPSRAAGGEKIDAVDGAGAGANQADENDPKNSRQAGVRKDMPPRGGPSYDK
jgi:hypothetical protein